MSLPALLASPSALSRFGARLRMNWRDLCETRKSVWIVASLAVATAVAPDPIFDLWSLLGFTPVEHVAILERVQ
jgi:hypothetical protein